MSYQDAVDNASDIVDAVNDKSMPPWPAGWKLFRFWYINVYCRYRKLMKSMPGWTMAHHGRQFAGTFSSGILRNCSTDKSWPHCTDSSIHSEYTQHHLYRCFVLPTGISLHKYITALEAIPGNRSVVHHVNLFRHFICSAQLDAADPQPGYTNFGGTGSAYSKLIGCGCRTGSRISSEWNGHWYGCKQQHHLQIHYPRGIVNQVDSTQIRFQLTSGFQREVSIDAPLNHYALDNGPLFIPRIKQELSPRIIR